MLWACIAFRTCKAWAATCGAEQRMVDIFTLQLHTFQTMKSLSGSGNKARATEHTFASNCVQLWQWLVYIRLNRPHTSTQTPSLRLYHTFLLKPHLYSGHTSTQTTLLFKPHLSTQTTPLYSDNISLLRLHLTTQTLPLYSHHTSIKTRPEPITLQNLPIILQEFPK